MTHQLPPRHAGGPCATSTGCRTSSRTSSASRSSRWQPIWPRHHADDGPHGAGDHHRRGRSRSSSASPSASTRRSASTRSSTTCSRRSASSASRCRRSGSRCCCRSRSSTSTCKWQRPDLLHVGPEQPSRRAGVVARPAAASRAAGDHALRHQLRALQPLHARVDARRDQQRLRAYRAREGRVGVAGDHAPRLPQRADPASRRSPPSTSAPCSAARSSPRPSSRSTAWATTSSRGSGSSTLRGDGLPARHLDRHHRLQPDRRHHCTASSTRASAMTEIRARPGGRWPRATTRSSRALRGSTARTSLRARWWPPSTTPHAAGLELKARSQWSYARMRFFRHRLALVGLFGLVIIFGAGIFANFVAPYSYSGDRPQPHPPARRRRSATTTSARTRSAATSSAASIFGHPHLAWRSASSSRSSRRSSAWSSARSPATTAAGSTTSSCASPTSC